MSTWPTSEAHHRWLDQHTRDLLAFGRRTADPEGGARWLGAGGLPDTERPTSTLISSRMAHVYGIGTLLGVPGSAPIALSALQGLTDRLRDPEHGGWFPSTEDKTVKSCYDQAFVLLAAATTAAAGLPWAAELFAEAEIVFLRRFWDDNAGRCVDTWNADFTKLEDYRGLNGNMHAVEAMLTAAGVTGDEKWLDRAIRVCWFVAKIAEAHDWRIPEHYDRSWQPLPEFNRQRPDDPFKPYGATVGHGLEWARLFLHAEAARPPGSDRWLAEAAAELFDRAVRDGWSVDGLPGFVYTTDWSGTPVVRDRMHWVAAEGISAAAALHHRFGKEQYATWYRTWWDYSATYLLDHEQGSWFHQLNAENEPTDTVWPGKPDLYHALQATLTARLPLYPMLAPAVAATLA
ncbi:AGE family epimerase/isomerase [Amorphoplanes digitatis]|uniref:Mannose/cellobiose epimerase-like protein (N-acyl-D-glucosamine 2-epimerase family) n=1 Tax=Actinoplanes digitatis TaxID=1868 RepID=A0A7W7HZ94_9ACTN|nr:AGE family epimerase/isomerase [Actinoplanes digitatis]MBB4763513.1 mannose/cellobiose epimerase-like protein (N-acyl-D-glucosamine 2-epimerase family) [Actinoplanes digitatis]BFE72641.1 AGE family epimerase/isomerase [Actinoplanes digitatis]GID93230.1 N-acylglucosamine 2-epimerase [Actinoplanes digitatis]